MRDCSRSSIKSSTRPKQVIRDLDCGFGSLNAFTALQRTFAYTNNIFMRDMGTDDIESLIDVVKIALPPGSDSRDRPPLPPPFPVMADDNVTVALGGQVFAPQIFRRRALQRPARTSTATEPVRAIIRYTAKWW